MKGGRRLLQEWEGKKKVNKNMCVVCGLAHVKARETTKKINEGPRFNARVIVG